MVDGSKGYNVIGNLHRLFQKRNIFAKRKVRDQPIIFFVAEVPI